MIFWFLINIKLILMIFGKKFFGKFLYSGIVNLKLMNKYWEFLFNIIIFL